jgi:hypothetical protein
LMEYVPDKKKRNVEQKLPKTPRQHRSASLT